MVERADKEGPSKGEGESLHAINRETGQRVLGMKIDDRKREEERGEKEIMEIMNH